MFKIKKWLSLRGNWAQENNYVDLSYPVVQHALDFLIEQMDDAILDSETREMKAKYAVKNLMSLGFMTVKCTGIR